MSFIVAVAVCQCILFHCHCIDTRSDPMIGATSQECNSWKQTMLRFIIDYKTSVEGTRGNILYLSSFNLIMCLLVRRLLRQIGKHSTVIIIALFLDKLKNVSNCMWGIIVQYQNTNLSRKISLKEFDLICIDIILNNVRNILFMLLHEAYGKVRMLVKIHTIFNLMTMTRTKLCYMILFFYNILAILFCSRYYT